MTSVTQKSTLLDYAINTVPDPLQASPQNGNAIYAALTLVVSNSSATAISVESIQVTIPPDLTDDLGAILYNADPQRIWSITPANPGVFNIEPVSGKPVVMTNQGVVFQFYNIAVDQQPGTVSIVIIETASSSSEPPDDRTTDISVTKFPYGFFFSNFTPQVPLVQDNQPVTLTWEGSNDATYTMHYANHVQDVTNVRSWTSGPLTADTTFLLRATVVSRGETVTKDLTTTVIVANPEIQADSIYVNNNAFLQGNTSIGSPGGATTLNVYSSANLLGNVTLGPTTSAQLTVSGETRSYGMITAANGIYASGIDVRDAKVENTLVASDVSTTSLTVGTGGIGNLSCDELNALTMFKTANVFIVPWVISLDGNQNLVFSYVDEPVFTFTVGGQIIITLPNAMPASGAEDAVKKPNDN